MIQLSTAFFNMQNEPNRIDIQDASQYLIIHQNVQPENQNRRTYIEDTLKTHNKTECTVYIVTPFNNNVYSPLQTGISQNGETP